MPRRPKGSGTPAGIASRVREAQALQLRANGATYSAIAESLGMTEAGVYTAVKRAMDRIPEPDVAFYRKLQVEQINESYQIVSRIALNPPPILDKAGRPVYYDHQVRDNAGNVVRTERRPLLDVKVQMQAVAQRKMLLERMAALLGLDAEQKFQLTGPDNGPIQITVDSLMDRTKNLLEQLRPQLVEAVKMREVGPGAETNGHMGSDN